jgi:hypothetical protein
MFQKQGSGGKDVGSGNGVTDERIDQIFRETDPTKLDEWTRKFLASTKEWWGRNRRLSDKQRKRLAEIGRKQSEASGPKKVS